MARVRVKRQEDVEHLVKSMFRDEAWKEKVGVGGMIAGGAAIAMIYNYVFCLPIYAALGALVIGYNLRCIRSKVSAPYWTSDDDPYSRMPEWNEWGDLFMSGITWLALQTAAWGLTAIFCLAILLVSSFYALNEKSTMLSQVWAISACVIVSIIWTAMSLLSSYLMVNFAIKENVQAGLAYIKVTRLILSTPTPLLAGFLLATGMQSILVLLPCITIIGIFLAPSCFFIGQVLGAMILAKHWAEVATSEDLQVTPPAETVS